MVLSTAGSKMMKKFSSYLKALKALKKLEKGDIYRYLNKPMLFDLEYHVS